MQTVDDLREPLAPWRLHAKGTYLGPAAGNSKAHLLCYFPDKPERLEGLCRRNSLLRKNASKLMAIKVAHDVMKPEEEFRERSVLAVLEADAVQWRKLPDEARVGFSEYESARLGAERTACHEAGEGLSRRVEAAYQALGRCPAGRSAILYLTSDLAASKPCAELLSKHPSARFEGYRREVDA